MPDRPPVPDAYERIFAALAHPARRQILITLQLEGGALSAGEIAGLFAHAWPTTTRHLQALQDAGLVVRERHGRSQIYRIVLKPIELAREWLAAFAAETSRHPRRPPWPRRRKP